MGGMGEDKGGTTDRRTDGQTDRRTDGQTDRNIAHSTHPQGRPLRRQWDCTREPGALAPGSRACRDQRVKRSVVVAIVAVVAVIPVVAVLPVVSAIPIIPVPLVTPVITIVPVAVVAPIPLVHDHDADR